jgi:hypothetical protein
MGNTCFFNRFPDYLSFLNLILFLSRSFEYNSCFSVIQILHLTTPVRRIILSPSQSPSSSSSSSLLQSLQKLFGFLSCTPHHTLSPPLPLLRARPSHFIPGHQQVLSTSLSLSLSLSVSLCLSLSFALPLPL